MKVARYLFGIAGLGLVLWGVLGLWAASLPEEGAPVDDFWRSGLMEVALGASLIILALLMRRRLKGQAQ